MAKGPGRIDLDGNAVNRHHGIWARLPQHADSADLDSGAVQWSQEAAALEEERASGSPAQVWTLEPVRSPALPEPGVRGAARTPVAAAVA